MHDTEKGGLMEERSETSFGKIVNHLPTRSEQGQAMLSACSELSGAMVPYIHFCETWKEVVNTKNLSIPYHSGGFSDTCTNTQ